MNTHHLLALIGISLVGVPCSLFGLAEPLCWTTRGHSMGVAVRPGSVVLPAHRPFSQIQLYDIVLFHPQGHWTTATTVIHRTIAHWGNCWETKGDNNRFPDPGYLTEKNYIDCVGFIQRPAVQAK